MDQSRVLAGYVIELVHGSRDLCETGGLFVRRLTHIGDQVE